eukprot:394380-Rhodomonas_salina.1
MPLVQPRPATFSIGLKGAPDLENARAVRPATPLGPLRRPYAVSGTGIAQNGGAYNAAALTMAACAGYRPYAVSSTGIAQNGGAYKGGVRWLPVLYCDWVQGGVVLCEMGRYTGGGARVRCTKMGGYNGGQVADMIGTEHHEFHFTVDEVRALCLCLCLCVGGGVSVSGGLPS